MNKNFRGNTSFFEVVPNSYVHSFECSGSRTSMLILIGFSITNILLILPLSTLVLCLGCRRWRQQRYVSTATTSHADAFTYHILVMEMITVLACFLYCVSAYTDLSAMMAYSLEVFSSTWCIKVHFHTLTCVERYLAVLHPVTYLRLKNKGGARIRNICIGCVWLLSFVWGILLDLTNNTVNTTVYFCLVGLASAVICFCCISVLLALRRPGPGQVRGAREGVESMKRRAFNTIVIIMGVLLLCLVAMVFGDAQVSQQVSDRACVVMAAAVCFSLPSSFVLPLLYLHRAGKLPGCKHNCESG